MYRDHNSIQTIVRILERFHPHTPLRTKHLAVNLAMSILTPMDKSTIFIKLKLLSF